MFISSVVTFKSLDDLSLFWEVWPMNWFYAILIAFPAIMILSTSFLVNNEHRKLNEQCHLGTGKEEKKGLIFPHAVIKK